MPICINGVWVDVGGTLRKDPIGLQLMSVNTIHAPGYATLDINGTQYQVTGGTYQDVPGGKVGVSQIDVRGCCIDIVLIDRWTCDDKCASGIHQRGEYATKVACQAACGQPLPGGFTIKASVTSGWNTYTTKVTISKPDSILNKVNLVMAAPLIGYSCLLADIPLDPITKTAVVELQVTESMTIMATSGLGCCSLYEPLTCESSNTLALKVGIDWMTVGLLGAGVLLAYAFISGRNKGGGTTVITGARGYDIKRGRSRR